MGAPLSRPTADSTAVAESWLHSQRDLHALLEEALTDPDIAEALEEEGIPPAEARSTTIEDPNVLAALRDIREWRRVWTDDVSVRNWGLRSGRLAGLRPGVRLVIATLVVVAYLGLTFASVPVMPFWANLLSLAGFVATVGFAVGLAGEEVWSVVIAVRNARDWRNWRRYALDEVVLPRLRQFIDERRAPDYDTTLAIEHVYSLYQEEDDAPVIVTSAGQRLRRIMARPTSDAVAIAGYRGVGKTTAIRAAARGMFSDPGVAVPLGVVVSAPSRYEARDFVLHLHAVLAKRVLALTGSLLDLPRDGDQPRAGRLIRLGRAAVNRLVRLVVVTAPLLGAAYLADPAGVRHLGAAVIADFPGYLLDLLWVFDDRPVGLRVNTVAGILLTGAAAAPVIVVLTTLSRLVDWLRRLSRSARQPEVAALRAEAVRQLDRIRFLQTYTSGWSGKVGIPLPGSDLGWTRGSQRAEQQLTHPEVVEAFREFAGQAAAVLIRRRAIERILVAVDELDKIAEPEKAHEFVNDIKGIFGVEGCLFLVAVSEDAISAFERRGLPVRDAFDSAFSEMIRMDPFTLEESRRWMGRRLLGVPVPFSCLCHCLSGGLPRDLRRSTVDMINISQATDSRDLESITAAMVGLELDRKAHAFAAAARRLDDSAEATEHLADLLLIPLTRTPAELLELAGRLAPGAESAMPGLRWQSACFVLFCATVRQVFTNDLTESGLALGVELLGTARVQLAVDPRVAWRVVCDVRERYGLPAPG
ncbi:hypothetical protein [Actinophytocola gossypii]|uniref:KAP NTPase domain-containing protein n=1 Tax=Actinophytocola gossypii TaxID=2812003 RepID=A0ABT2JJZ2_9PSEU|nr:hypothetical protein [Actinophytocola gossypii]MCT2588209.1 hypothetical protein [Actinophytocola gossypii]